MYITISLIILSLLYRYNTIWQDSIWGASTIITSISMVILILLFIITLILTKYIGRVRENKVWLGLHNTLLTVLVWFFITTNRINFYIIFELSLLPLFLIVIGWGYQPERITAGLWIFFYTLIAAVPIILFIIYFKEKSIREFISTTLLRMHRPSDIWILVLLLSGFMVKFPIYGLHLWLPRAHVEAPLIGSVILAALILKLAGYGVFIFIAIIKSPLLIEALKVFSIVGGGIVRFCCIYEKDIKKLIAYTSVAHISFVIYSLLRKKWLGLYGAQLFILSHGICSRGLFIRAFYIYTYTNSRSLVFNFGFLSRAPQFTLFLFILCIANIRGPPSSNFFAEILCLIQSLLRSSLIIIPIFLLTFIRVVYSLVLYRHSQYGQSQNLIRFSSINILEANIGLFISTWIFLCPILIL